EARVNYLHCDHVMFKITGPTDVANFVRSILTDNSREHFVALYLNASHQVAAYSIVSIGSANSAPVAPREVFQRAVLTGAISIVVAHNHPSDSTEPSTEDRAVTKRLRDAGQLLGIKVLDHLIVTDSAYLSLKDDEGW
ncbi:MAG: JAB domain-containing protein, partial [Planctomycetaceae bacterium]